MVVGKSSHQIIKGRSLVFKSSTQVISIKELLKVTSSVRKFSAQLTAAHVTCSTQRLFIATILLKFPTTLILSFVSNLSFYFFHRYQFCHCFLRYYCQRQRHFCLSCLKSILDRHHHNHDNLFL